MPLVLPVVVYHGPAPWPRRRQLSARVDLDPGLRAALGAWVPELDVRLVEVGPNHAAALDRAGLRAFGELTLRMLGRLPYCPDPLAELRTLTPLVRRVLAARQGLPRFCAVLHYINRASGLRAEELRPWALALGPGAERATMGFLDEMREEGFRQGQAEGRGLGEIEVLLRLLTLKFGPLPADVEARVRGSTAEARAVWTERVLTADSLAAVLAGR